MGLECDIADDEVPQSDLPRPQTAITLSARTENSTPEEIFPPQSICDELVDIYFDYLHDKQHCLFHRPSFIENQRRGFAPPVLIAAILALSARFSTNEYFENVDPHVRGRVWAEYARKLFFFRTEAVSLTAIQTCIMLGGLAFIEEDIANESLYGAQAIRMVQLLDLPNNLSSNWVQREVEIRVWWSIWMMDNWSSAGAKLPKQLVDDPSFPRPMEEVAFEALDPNELFVDEFDQVGDAIERSSQGLWAQMIPLTQIMTQVVDVNEFTVQNPLLQAEIFEKVEAIGNKLDSWLFRLPCEFHITPETLKRYSDVGHGRTLLALHLGFHHHAQVLYYQFLPGQSNAFNEKIQRAKYATRCKEHASELSNLLWLANTTTGCECLWAVTGHLLVISSSVHLHTLLFDDNEVQIEQAKNMLKQNFEMMLHLQKYWPSLNLSLSRLRAFHRACREHMHTSFAMDHWMLLFLQRYMKPVGERAPDFSSDQGPDQLDLPILFQDFGSEAGSATSFDPELLKTGSGILQTFLSRNPYGL